MTNELRHTPKLRLLSAFLAAAMTLTTLPAAAFAADGITSDLSVAGTSVTANNATDILGDGTGHVIRKQYMADDSTFIG